MEFERERQCGVALYRSHRGGKPGRKDTVAEAIRIFEWMDGGGGMKGRNSNVVAYKCKGIRGTGKGVGRVEIREVFEYKNKAFVLDLGVERNCAST